jgi:hypothetical protein
LLHVGACCTLHVACLHVACCLLLVARCMFTCCLLHVACCMLSAARCLLHVVCCTLSAACCLLHGVCCTLSAARCPLHGEACACMPPSCAGSMLSVSATYACSGLQPAASVRPPRPPLKAEQRWGCCWRKGLPPAKCIAVPAQPPLVIGRVRVTVDVRRDAPLHQPTRTASDAVRSAPHTGGVRTLWMRERSLPGVRLW